MNPFHYHQGELHCEGVPLSQLAKIFGTPVYIYSQKAIADRCQEFVAAFRHYPTHICYAVKANSNLSILKEIHRHGLGADLVSVGELERATIAGIPPRQLVFSGVGKTRAELSRALECGILFFNVESAFEIDLLGSVAAEMGRTAAVSLRMNPNIDAKTHAKIATGLNTTKFGLPESDLLPLAAQVDRHPHLQLVGLSCHIGSQITELAPLRQAGQRMADLALLLQQRGFKLQYLDLGGGLGIHYQNEQPPSLESYALTLIEAAERANLTLVIEPGRSIIGNAGLLLTEVIGLKDSGAKRFVIVDAAMNDLLRPTLYEAYHEIIPVTEIPTEAPKTLCDVVGPVCETGDFLAKDRQLHPPSPQSLLAIKSCGAYGWSMSSQYNSRPRPAEVMVQGDKWHVIRPRESLTSLWEPEIAGLIAHATPAAQG